MDFDDVFEGLREGGLTVDRQLKYFPNWILMQLLKKLSKPFFP